MCSGSRVRGHSGLARAPAVPNSNIRGCLQSSLTHTSPGQMDQEVFSTSDRAQGYLGTWSIIALRSLPAALKISTPPQHPDTPIFIQKCISEAEAKSSTRCCGLKKSNYKENKGEKHSLAISMALDKWWGAQHGAWLELAQSLGPGIGVRTAPKCPQPLLCPIGALSQAIKQSTGFL